MNVLVTGCHGLLGQKLIQYAPDEYQVFGIDIHEDDWLGLGDRYRQLDLLKRDELKNYMQKINPGWILNAAGYTDVDGAETEKDLCWRINVTAVDNLAYAARKVKAKVVHVSTDYIFDGTDGPYDEEAVPNPIGFYGRSKLASENVLKTSPIEFAIVRTMVLYGKGKQVRPNFVTWLIEKLQNGERVRIVDDQFGNTTLADELALGIWKIVEKSATEIFNIAGREIVDRYTFAQKIAHVFDLDETLIQPIKTSELQQPAPRPLNSGLIVDKAIRELGIELSDVEGGPLKFKRQIEGSN